jgi:hypothetical protein
MTLTIQLSTIILHFPQRLRGGWMDLKVPHDSIKRGGFPEVAWTDATNARRVSPKIPGFTSTKPAIARFAHWHNLVMNCSIKLRKTTQHSVVGSGQQERISPNRFLRPRWSEEDEQLKSAIATLKKHGLALKKKEHDNDRDNTDSGCFDDDLSVESEEESEVPDHCYEQDLLEESTLQVENDKPSTERPLHGGGDKPSDFRIVDVDNFRNSIQMANNHGRNCCGSLEFKKRSKRGFAATVMFLCDKCGKEF